MKKNYQIIILKKKIVWNLLVKDGKFDILNKKLNDKEIDQQNNYLYKDISFATDEDDLEIEDKSYINRSEDEI